MNYETDVALCGPNNSQIFTTCCGSAVCADEEKCPTCGKIVYGYDAESENNTRRYRWDRAYGKAKRGNYLLILSTRVLEE